MADSSVKFKTYPVEIIKALGKALILVCYKPQTFIFLLYIMEADKPNLSQERHAIEFTVKLEWVIFYEKKKNLEHVLDKCKEIFLDELETMKNEKTKIYIKPNSIPKFLNTHHVPYALKQKNWSRIRKKG